MLGQFANLRRWVSWQERGGGVFERGLIPQCTLCFGNDFARNAIIFDVDNSSSSHTHNLKNNFLVLDEGPTDDISGSIDAAQKKFCFSKAIATFCLRLHCNYSNSNLLVNKQKENLNGMKKAGIKISTFHLNFVLEHI